MGSEDIEMQGHVQSNKQPNQGQSGHSNSQMEQVKEQAVGSEDNEDSMAKLYRKILRN